MFEAMRRSFFQSAPVVLYLPGTMTLDGIYDPGIVRGARTKLPSLYT